MDPTDPLNTANRPANPSRETKVLAMVWPATKLTFETAGFGDPNGHTIRWPPDTGSTAVTVPAIADTPVAGIPDRPAIVNPVVLPLATAPVVVRVSDNPDGCRQGDECPGRRALPAT